MGRAGRLAVLLLAAGTASSAAPAAAAATAPDAVLPANATLDRILEDTRARYRLPGLAVGVIADGRVVYRRALGETRAGSGEPVTTQTLFKIASNSKPMTTAALARLVDRGLLRWDDPVTRHLPTFRMHDPWVTREIQLRDLLIHNSGLGAGAGDLMLWPEPNDFSRSDLLAGLAHLKPVHSFRSRYAYDNLLYVVAGEVAAAATGLPFEQVLEREVFAPLGLARCRASGFALAEAGSVAQPHMREGERQVPIRLDGPQVPTSTALAAGGVRCSLDDLLRWAQAWLDEDNPWLSPAQRAALWTAHMPLPIGARQRAWDGTRWRAYGYGWRLSDTDGEWTVSHTGTLAGMYSVLTLFPDRDAGFVVLMNGEGEAARSVLTRALSALFTAPKRLPDVAQLAAALEAERASQPPLPAPVAAAERPAAASELGARLGRYRDPWFGEVQLCAEGDAVRWRSLKSPRLVGRVHGDAATGWQVRWEDPSVDSAAWLRFGTGSTSSLAMAPVSADADFSYDWQDLAFNRVGDCPPPVSPARTPAEAGFVDPATLAPDLHIAMAYAGTGNFTGRVLPGYGSGTCLLLAPVAEALARVAARLQRDGYGLVVYDCYRPLRAVAAMNAWARDPDTSTRERYYPSLEKSALVPDYIAEYSGHSRGTTVDLGLLRCRGAQCSPLDMGTAFDFFGPQAHTDSTAVAATARRHRARLRDAMQAEGFVNYPLEWWHFRWQGDAGAGPAYGFDIP